MTDARESAARKYLRKSLVLDPVHSAGKLIRRREQLLGIATAQANRLASAEAKHEDHAKQQRLRESARRKLETLRTEFWNVSDAQLQQALREIPVEGMPELAISVERLRRCAALRPRLIKFEQQGRVKDHRLWQAFCWAITASPTDAGHAKEQYLRDLAATPSVIPTRATVRRLQRLLPEAYSMEADWFDEVRRVEPHQRDSFRTLFNHLPNWAWTLIFLVAMLLLFLLLVAVWYSEYRP